MSPREYYLQDEESANDSEMLLLPETQQRRVTSNDSEDEEFFSQEKEFVDIDFSYQKKVKKTYKLYERESLNLFCVYYN